MGDQGAGAPAECAAAEQGGDGVSQDGNAVEMVSCGEEASRKGALEQARAEVASLREQLSAATSEREALSAGFRDELEQLVEQHVGETQRLRASHDALEVALRLSRSETAAISKRLKASEELRVRQRKLQRSRTPTERVMRRIFARKVEALALTHARTTARMLNVQKRCFEEELESLEAEAHATVVAFERQFAALRDDVAVKDEEHARERDAAYAKTAAVMAAVKKRIERADARLAAVERQRDAAAAAAHQRHALLDALARERAAARADAEAARTEVGRKNRLVDRLQTQLSATCAALAETRECLNASKEGSENALPAIARLARRSPADAQRLGNLFATVIAEFANARVDDGDEEAQPALVSSGIASARG